MDIYVCTVKRTMEKEGWTEMDDVRISWEGNGFLAMEWPCQAGSAPHMQRHIFTHSVCITLLGELRESTHFLLLGKIIYTHVLENPSVHISVPGRVGILMKTT